VVEKHADSIVQSLPYGDDPSGAEQAPVFDRAILRRILSFIDAKPRRLVVFATMGR